jgi:hypothetical protein
VGRQRAVLGMSFCCPCFRLAFFAFSFRFCFLLLLFDLELLDRVSDLIRRGAEIKESACCEVEKKKTDLENVFFLSFSLSSSSSMNYKYKLSPTSLHRLENNRANNDDDDDGSVHASLSGFDEMQQEETSKEEKNSLFFFFF